MEHKTLSEHPVNLVLGCDIQTPGVMGILSGVYADDTKPGVYCVVKVPKTGKEKGKFFSFTERSSLCKPVLRRLSDITEEERNHYLELLAKDAYMLPPRAGVYLASRHFDIGLFEKGAYLLKDKEGKIIPENVLTTH